MESYKNKTRVLSLDRNLVLLVRIKSVLTFPIFTLEDVHLSTSDPRPFPTLALQITSGN